VQTAIGNTRMLYNRQRRCNSAIQA